MSGSVSKEGIDYGKPRTVWLPGDSDPITTWWEPIPLMLFEDSDLTANEVRLMCQLIGRTNGNKGFRPFGAAFLAKKLGIQTRTWMHHAETLQERGMILIHGEGQHKMEFEVLWCPPWRELGDPPEKWNPPIRLDKAPIRSRLGPTPRIIRTRKTHHVATRHQRGLTANAQMSR